MGRRRNLSDQTKKRQRCGAPKSALPTIASAVRPAKCLERFKKTMEKGAYPALGRHLFKGDAKRKAVPDF